MASLGVWAEDFAQGEATATEVITEARSAARRVSGTDPSDPSLRRTKVLLAAMFVEYGRAVHDKEKAKESDAGKHMYRAYGLANFAHEVLSDAAPELRKRGCDVAPLL